MIRIFKGKLRNAPVHYKETIGPPEVHQVFVKLASMPRGTNLRVPIQMPLTWLVGEKGWQVHERRSYTRAVYRRLGESSCHIIYGRRTGNVFFKQGSEEHYQIYFSTNNEIFKQRLPIPVEQCLGIEFVGILKNAGLL